VLITTANRSGNTNLNPMPVVTLNFISRVSKAVLRSCCADVTNGKMRMLLYMLF